MSTSQTKLTRAMQDVEDKDIGGSEAPRGGRQYPKKRVGRGTKIRPSDISTIIQNAVDQVTDLLYTKDISHTVLRAEVIAVLEDLIAYRVLLVLDFEKPDPVPPGEDYHWLESPQDRVTIFNLMREYLIKQSTTPEYADILKRYNVALGLYRVNSKILADLQYTE